MHQLTSMTSWLLAVVTCGGALSGCAGGGGVERGIDGSACASTPPPHVVVKRAFSAQECAPHHMKRALSLRQENTHPLVMDQIVFFLKRVSHEI